MSNETSHHWHNRPSSFTKRNAVFVAIGIVATRLLQTSPTRSALNVLIQQDAWIAIRHLPLPTGALGFTAGGHSHGTKMKGYTLLPGTTIVGVFLPKIKDLPATLSAIADLKDVALLGLNDPQLRDEHLRAMSVAKLADLDLSGSSVTGVGLRHLERFPLLLSLRLTKLNIGDADLVTLSRLRGLSHLHLNQTQIGDEGVVHLLNLPFLRQLDLCGTNLSDQGLMRLQEFKSLTDLDVTNTKVTAGGIAQFQQSRPQCRVKSNASDDDAATMATKPSTESN
jgi:hypothetical protein